ncbi:MAG TPA: Tim44 domain-containing protein [Candidatus Methylomirabilis sp.]|nr:Tim44 domain-containing protein [Candidatus Methylomirabilis sp.]
MNAHVKKGAGAILVVATVLALAMPVEVWARAGSGISSGSRGSRSYSSPSRSYSAPSRPTSPSTQPLTQPTPAPTPLGQPSPAGGFFRSLAGGVLGGFLGGMLFRSLGFAGGEGASGSGFGMFDLLLLAGIGYLIFWMVRRNRMSEEAPAAGYYGRTSAESVGTTVAPAATLDQPPLFGAEDREQGLTHIRQMDPRFDEVAFTEWCTDTFFRIQAAWMRRDVDALKPVLTEEMQESFRKQIEDAKAKGQTNKLENITVRSVQITEVWQEQGLDYMTVRFLANLLDSTVEDATGKVVSGSATEPVKFEEYWTWVRPVGPNPWRLSAINQAD